MVILIDRVGYARQNGKIINARGWAVHLQVRHLCKFGHEDREGQKGNTRPAAPGKTAKEGGLPPTLPLQLPIHRGRVYTT